MMSTASYQRELRKKRQKFFAAQEAKGFVHWSGKVWITKKEFQRRYEEALELGRQADEEYRNRLIARYGNVPDWAPSRIRR